MGRLTVVFPGAAGVIRAPSAGYPEGAQRIEGADALVPGHEAGAQAESGGVDDAIGKVPGKARRQECGRDGGHRCEGDGLQPLGGQRLSYPRSGIAVHAYPAGSHEHRDLPAADGADADPIGGGRHGPRPWHR